MPSLNKVILLVLCLGGLFWVMGAAQPVYTDAEAPGRLSFQLSDLPREQRFSQWHEELRHYETSHKWMSDFGRGLIAFGLGLGLAASLRSMLRNTGGRARVALFTGAWIGLWAARMPFTFWYYTLRQQRFDYPVWGDSIAIPVLSENLSSAAGCVLLGILAALLMIRHSIDSSFTIRKPSGFVGWLRAGILWLWAAVLLLCIVGGTWDGNEGLVVCCLGASPLLLALITAVPTAKTPESGLNP